MLGKVLTEAGPRAVQRGLCVRLRRVRGLRFACPTLLLFVAASGCACVEIRSVSRCVEQLWGESGTRFEAKLCSSSVERGLRTLISTPPRMIHLSRL